MPLPWQDMTPAERAMIQYQLDRQAYEDARGAAWLEAHSTRRHVRIPPEPDPVPFPCDVEDADA